MTYEVEIQRGAALLDEMKPGWVDKIDLPALSVESSLACVLGQVYGEYSRGCRELFGELHGLDERLEHGFTVMSGRAAFAELTQEWRDYVIARRLAAQPEPEVTEEELPVADPDWLREEVLV